MQFTLSSLLLFVLLRRLDITFDIIGVLTSYTTFVLCMPKFHVWLFMNYHAMMDCV